MVVPWFRVLYKIIDVGQSAHKFIWLAISIVQEWYDLSKDSQVRRLQPDQPIPDPFWPTTRPFRNLTNVGSDPRRIKPDPAHCYAIKGWGKDLCAGGLILLLRLGVLDGGTIRECFENAFECFRDHCRSNGKTTSITEFSLKTMKIDSCPDRY